MIKRGVHVPPSITAAQVEELNQADCNLIRFAIAPYYTLDEADWARQVQEHSQKLSDFAWQYPHIEWVANLARVITIDGVATAWNVIKQFVSHLPNVRYGILNEPPYSRRLTRQLMTSIPARTSAVTFPYSDPPHFVRAKPYGITHAWYEVHMYLPFSYTHAGVYPQYPISGAVRPSKAEIKHSLRAVRSFQLRTRRKIYVGEFSASVHVPDRALYIKDCIDLFEEYGWHWTYHAAYESEHWDPNVGGVTELLNSYFERNNQ